MTARAATPAARELIPASALPAAYYLVAHGALFAALAALTIDPTIAGPSFYHPRVISLVHLVTLGWISGSILGSFYIVGPLALRVPMPVGAGDWIMFAAFVVGTSQIADGFWTGRYDRVAWSAVAVTLAISWVGLRALRGLRRSPVPAGISTHVVFAFLNILVAAAAGWLLAWNRSRGFLEVSPLALVFAHAHLAVLGWGTMMVVGLAYRLIPMFVPSAMPTGRGLFQSAILLECGVAVVFVTLLYAPGYAVLGAGFVLAGLWRFSQLMRASVRARMPRPPALPARDWSTWQAHLALLWLLIAVLLGFALAIGVPAGSRLSIMWLYGVAGIVGFLSQMVTGIQGRLVPFYAWYREMARIGRPPTRGANTLPSARFAALLFITWTVGVPLLAIGLAFERPSLVRVGAATLGMALAVGLAYMHHMLSAARR